MKLGGFSTHQADVVRHLCAGQCDDAIDADLGIAARTAGNYRIQVRRRLGLDKGTLPDLCRALGIGEEMDSHVAPDPPAQMGVEVCVPFRVEHHAVDGSVRVLASSWPTNSGPRALTTASLFARRSANWSSVPTRPPT